MVVTGKINKISVLFIIMGILYSTVLTIGIITRYPDTNNIINEIMYLMGFLTIISAFVVMAFVNEIYKAFGKNYGYSKFLNRIAIMFLVVITTIVHFLHIFFNNKKIGNENFEIILTLEWPSFLLLLDIIAWNFFFGLGILILGFFLVNKIIFKSAGIIFIISGILSIIGLVSIPLNNMDLRFIGIIGYTILPVIGAICIKIKINSM